jgi:hypothetical protein
MIFVSLLKNKKIKEYYYLNFDSDTSPLRFLLITVTLFCLQIFVYPQSDQSILDRKSAYAIYTDTKPKIDGIVDACWLNAKSNNDFIQRQPAQGEEATNQTNFFILYDSHKIYILFIMRDPNPRNISARLVERDYNFDPDDNINFYLDTFNDRQRAYYFSTNPYGVERDGLISDNGSNVDINWDGIYEVAARKNNYGWVAEFAVPFNTLRFDDSNEQQIWGFNTWRVQKENREISYWSLVDQNYEPFRLDKGGVIIGKKNIQSGKHLEILPYLTAQHNQIASDRSTLESDLEGNFGFDLKYGVASDLTANLTVNPDFGQVEIDEEQINLDKRFELFLEEKRPFFLENTNLFQLPISTFYSRRIGAGSDIKAGLKATGKFNSYSFGYTGALTGDWKNSGLGDPNDDNTDELFSILRFQKDVLNNSNIGLMFSDVEENFGSDNSFGYNRSLSLDMNLYLGRYNHFIGQLVGASANSPRLADKGESGAARAFFSHYNQKYWFYLDGFFYDPNFEVNGTGFFQKVPNKGRKDFHFYADTHPFVNSRYLRSWGIGSLQVIWRDSDESEISWGIQPKFWLEFRDQSMLTITTAIYKEVESDILTAYGLRNKNQLSYDGRDFHVNLTTDVGKPISISAEFNYDSQYYFQTHSTGYNRGLKTALLFKPVSNGFFEISFEGRQFLDNEKKLMPSDSIGQSNVRLFSFRGRYLFSKNVFSRAFIQFTNGAEISELQSSGISYTIFDRLSANVLFGWRFKPGSTLYLVYTEEWDNSLSLNLRTMNRIVFFKFSYLWNF